MDAPSHPNREGPEPDNLDLDASEPNSERNPLTSQNLSVLQHEFNQETKKKGRINEWDMKTAMARFEKWCEVEKRKIGEERPNKDVVSGDIS